MLFFVSAVGLLIACNAASDDNPASDTASTKEKMKMDLAAAKSTLQGQNTKFMNAFKSGDSSAIAALYTSDGVLLPPNQERIRGADIDNTWGSFMRMGVKEITLATDEVTGNEEMLAETGNYEIYGPDNKMWDKGKYIVLWKPENGEWKLHRDIWNSDMPAAGTK